MEVTLRSLAIITMVTACTFDTGGLDFSGDGSTHVDAATIDGPTGPFADADPHAPDAGVTGRDAGCPGDLLPMPPSNIDVCGIPASSSALDFGNRTWVLNTSTQSLRDVDANQTVPLESAVVSQTSGGADVLLVVADSITIADDGLVLAVGNRPLVMLAYSDITIDGLLVASSGFAPGQSSPDPCASSTGADGVVQDGSGSGAGGGGYGSKGGGGARVKGAGGALIIASGGNVSGNSAIIPLRGGCDGGDGANNPSGGGRGGAGGGALQLVAGGTITIGPGGAVSAPGNGATGTEDQSPLADDEAGGGGGGSGGAILLEASHLHLSGAVTANGGGGSEGTSVGNGYVGCGGENGVVNSDDPALGGVCEEICWGGDGGNGAARTSKAEDGKEGESNFDGGGGGGGGVGRIHFNTLSAPMIESTAIVSPAAE